jgi:hypothetical protein
VSDRTPSKNVALFSGTARFHSARSPFALHAEANATELPTLWQILLSVLQVTASAGGVVRKMIDLEA